MRWLLLMQSKALGRAGCHSCSTWAQELQAPEYRLSGCGTWAQLLCSMWNLPGSGIEPVFPALADGFFTTEPPGKSLNHMCFCPLPWYSREPCQKFSGKKIIMYRHTVEKEMTTHPSIPAWRIPWIEEPGRLQCMESQESDMT